MINKVIEAIKEAELHGLSIEKKSNVLSGFSGNKLVGSLQKIAALYEEDQEVCYLEVGVFQGLTLLSVASSCSKIHCYGIDDFTYFDPDGKNLSIVEQRAQKLGINNKFLVNEDYEDALESLDKHISNKKIGLYFVDGPHDYRSQLMCLELALPYLHKDSVIVVDDCNYPHVRQANRDFLVTHPEFKLVFEAYTKCHPKNMSSHDEFKVREGWWDGVNIIVRDTKNILKPMYPPTERNRLLYEHEHIVHASRVAEAAPQVLKTLGYIYSGNFLKTVKSLAGIYRDYRKNRHKYRDRFDNMNTFSENLPESRYNASL